MSTSEFKLVVFGDSVTWGQGLAPPEKYSTLVAKSIEEKLNVKVITKIYAHSGATINRELLSPGDKSILAKYGEETFDGEIPWAFPTITKQVNDFSPEEAKTVNLILLSGGINDVNVSDYILSLSSSEDDIKQRTLISCNYGMANLLEIIDKKFPNAKIIVTGYFRLVTEESNLFELASLSVYAQLAAISIYFLGLPSIPITATVSLGLLSILKDKWVKNWRTFYEASNQNLSESVSKIDNGRGKFLLAYPNIRDYEAIYTSNSNFYPLFIKLIGGEVAILGVEDSVKSARISQCKPLGSREPLVCRIASMGHPNTKGSRKYANAIVQKLFPPPSIPSYCKPIEVKIEDLERERNQTLEDANSAPSQLRGVLLRVGVRLGIQIDEEKNKLKQCIAGTLPTPSLPTPSSSYYLLGGNLTSGPAVGINANGTLEVFARRSDNALWHIWQTSPSGGWSNWTSLGGNLTSGPAVGINANGTLEVFARRSDNALWHIWQTSPSGGWSNWTSLGEPPGGNVYDEIGVYRNKNGTLEVFVIGSNNALWHIWQTSPSGGWSNWTSLGGNLTSGPAVGINANGTLEVFARRSDNALWHIWQTSPSGGWSNWTSLGGNLTSGPAVGINANGTLEVFARRSDNALWHIWQTSPSGGWSNWTSLGGNLTSGPSVGKSPDGRLYAFVRAANNSIWYTYQNYPSGSWSDWKTLRGFIDSKISIANNSQGNSLIFTRDEKNQLITAVSSTTDAVAAPNIESVKRWLRSLYLDLLNREPDQGGLNFYIDVLYKTMNKDEIVESILRSQEYGTIVTNSLYQKYLERQSDSSGLEYWRNILSNGTPIQNVIVGFCDSPEFKNKYPVPYEFTRALYNKILERPPEGGAAENNPLLHGVTTTDYIRRFLTSSEYSSKVITSYYNKYLGRAPERGPVEGEIPRTQNESIQQIIKGFLVSNEYYERSLKR